MTNTPNDDEFEWPAGTVDFSDEDRHLEICLDQHEQTDKCICRTRDGERERDLLEGDRLAEYWEQDHG